MRAVELSLYLPPPTGWLRLHPEHVRSVKPREVRPREEVFTWIDVVAGVERLVLRRYRFRDVVGRTPRKYVMPSVILPASQESDRRR